MFPIASHKGSQMKRCYKTLQLLCAQGSVGGFMLMKVLTILVDQP